MATEDDVLNLVATGLSPTEAATRLDLSYSDAIEQLRSSLDRLSQGQLGTDDSRIVQLRKLEIIQRAVMGGALKGEMAAARVAVRSIEIQNELLGLTNSGFLPTGDPDGGIVDELRARRANRHARPD